MAWYVVLTYMVTHSCASLVMRFLSCTVVRYYVYNSACLSTCLFTTNYVTFFSLPFSLTHVLCCTMMFSGVIIVVMVNVHVLLYGMINGV